MKTSKKAVSFLLGGLLFITLLLQFTAVNAFADTASSSTPGSSSIASGISSDASQSGDSNVAPPEISSDETLPSQQDSSETAPAQPEAEEQPDDASSLPEEDTAESEPAVIGQAALLFSQLYEGADVKPFTQLVEEGLLQPETENILLNFDLAEPTVFGGIPGLPSGIAVDIHIPGAELEEDIPFLAIGPGVVVNDITAGGEGLSIGGIAVMGTANSITIADQTSIKADVAIAEENGSYTWKSDDASWEIRTETFTGVVVGAYNGGVIHGDITLGSEITIISEKAGFLGSVVGAYRNAKVGNIIFGDDIRISAGYVQNVIGANEGSAVGNITMGTQMFLAYRNAEFAVIGAASGLPDDNRNPSTVGVITLRQNTLILDTTGGGSSEVYSNVGIGAERGSSVAQIRIEETLEWVSDINNATQMMYISNSSRVTIGAFDGATVGTGDGTDAIVVRYVSIWDSSYYSGALMIGADKNATILGNMVFQIAGISTSFGDEAPYKVVLGTGDNSHVTGTIRLHGVAYSSSWANPATLIGPSDSTSSVNEIKVEKFASIRSWNYDAINYSIFGSPGAKVGRLWIDGDLLIQMPRNTYLPSTFAAQGADFIADEILITSGNIIAQDLAVKYGGEPGSPTEQYWNDPDRMSKVPPWIHSDIKMSVPPKNQYGDILAPFTILDNRAVLGEQYIDPVSRPVSVTNNNGNTYTYRFGNDIRKYMIVMYGEEMGEGSIHPSWVPDIYPIWTSEGMELESPFVHFVYLPQTTISPVAYQPANDNAQFEAVGGTISVQLNMPLSLDYLADEGAKPQVKITNASTGEQVAAFVLNEENMNTYFTLKNSSGVSGKLGNTIEIDLNRIPGLQEELLYTVEIEQNNLFAEFAATAGLPILDVKTHNSSPIRWQFRIPAAEQLPPAPQPPAQPGSSQPAPPAPTPPVSSTPASSSGPRTPVNSTPGTSGWLETPDASVTQTPGLPLNPQNDGAANAVPPVEVTPVDKTRPAAAQQREETLNQLMDEGVPVLQIGGARVPLSGRNGFAVWSVFNLAATIMGIAGLLVMSVHLVIQKRRWVSEMEGESIHIGYFWQNTMFLRVAIIGTGLLLPILFAVTQNLQHLMVIFDHFSWLMGGLLSIQIVVSALLYHVKWRNKSNTM